ncbi:MAG TPA: OsmC family protein [Steroidobacteraceae bacterium]|nr:OsmC family protein [Steroidobacteraceae bacterium]
MRTHITTTVYGPFDSVLKDVAKSLSATGFGLLGEYDVFAALDSSTREPPHRHRILAVSHSGIARQALEREDGIAVLLPCNVVVREICDHQVQVASLDPLRTLGQEGTAALRTVATELRRLLATAISALGSKAHREHYYPQVYLASAATDASSFVTVTSPGVPALNTTVPPEYGGPGDTWSPETLLCAAVADCFVLSFRSLSYAAHLDWLHLDCRVEGSLDRIERVARFASYTLLAELTLPAGGDVAHARALLERADRYCRISNSLLGERLLETRIVMADSPATQFRS